MSNSNVVYLWNRFVSEKPHLEGRRNLLRECPRNLGIAGGFLADRKSGLSQDDHRDSTRSRFLQQLKRVAEEYRLI